MTERQRSWRVNDAQSRMIADGCTVLPRIRQIGLDHAPAMEDEPRMRPVTKAALFVAVVTALAFLPTLACDFVFDDIPLISSNEWVHSWQGLGRAFKAHFLDVSAYAEARELRDVAVHRYYRPLVTVSYLVDWKVGGGRPWAFHLTNTVLHATTAALVTRAASRWTGSMALGIVCALVFAIHPTRTECVTWISGRTDVMMTLFMLVALETFDVFERRRSRSEPHAWTFFALGIAAFVAGVLSKEPAALFVLLALADRAARPVDERSWLVVATTGLLGAGYVATRALVWMPERHVEGSFTPGHFLVTVAEYTKRAVLPWPQTMYYDALAVDDSGQKIFSVPTMIAGALCVAAMIAALVVAFRPVK
jgi:hypothetical protein